VQQLHLAPPVQRFVECSPRDLKLLEVAELLRDYWRFRGFGTWVGLWDEGSRLCSFCISCCIYIHVYMSDGDLHYLDVDILA